jgi:dipeptidyl-peptidase-4
VEPDSSTSFPRQWARTRRFTLGEPHAFRVAADGSAVAFLRSPAGDDPLTSLWMLDIASGEERLVCDPRELGLGDAAVPAAELTRRERVRESADGIVAFSADPRLERSVFALNGALYMADIHAGEARRLDTAGAVFDPQIDPTGQRVAFVSGRSLRVIEPDRPEAVVAAEDDPDVSWGSAEFVAAEEMDRPRGFWWSPDGTALAVARVDVGPVQRWHIANPASPEAEPAVVRYPAAGTANATVTLHVVRLGGEQTAVDWDRDAFPYLVQVIWNSRGPLMTLVQSRDQRRMEVLAVDAASGVTRVIHDEHDPQWLEIVKGVPDWLEDGRLAFTANRQDARCLTYDGEPVTPASLQLREVVDVGAGAVITAWETGQPEEAHVWRVDGAGSLTRMTEEPGVHTAAGGGGTLVVTSATMHGNRSTVFRDGKPGATIRSMAQQPVLLPRVRFARLGGRQLSSAILLPRDESDGPLPVLLDPYGGPHAQRVLRTRDTFLQSQWFADQGFAVLVADGRGTPGRGPGFEFAVQGDLATPPLEDQVDALHAAAETEPRMDLSRVAIRGWSFGGYLAALAVLRRPDVFHAAIAGAPVTDWRLYDTHYTERYLGDPNREPDAYRTSSLLEDAAGLERPLMIIHGLADDNVVVANSLRLSQALLEAGRPHTFLPLGGVTHMTPQEVVAENLLLLQVAFLRQALAL